MVSSATHLLLAALAALLPGDNGPSVEAQDPRAALRRLGHPSAHERRAAELWLARHLSLDNLGALAAGTLELELEARARLASAIGSDESHFALAALLASDREPVLRQLGEDALRRMMERWWGQVELAPAGNALVTAALTGHFSDRVVSMAIGARSLDEELNTVVRHLGVPEGLPLADTVAVVLDPSLYAAGLKEPHGGGEAVVKAPEQLLFTVIEGHGEATLQGFALDGPRSWLHVVHRGRAGAQTGAELVLEWCRAVVGDPDDALAEGSARALAATAWPAALDWLAWRWSELGDSQALSGLLLAAERGRVAPVLARGAAVERVLAAADGAVARGGELDLRFAEEVQRAVGALGGLADGGELTELVARGFDGLPVDSKRLRLGILAGLGRVPAPLVAELRAQLAAQVQPPARLAVDMVRALAHGARAESAAQQFVWRDPTPLFQGERRVAHFAVYDRWLAASGARPPEAWRDPGTAGSDGVTAIRRARILSWWLAVEPSAETAADHLIRLVDELDQLSGSAGGQAEANAGDRLSRVSRRGGQAALERLFERARERGGDPARLERLELLTGVLAPDRRSELLARLLADGGRVSEGDLQLLGVLAAELDDEVGAPAREAFRVHLHGAGTAGAPADARRDPPWVPALERSLRLLRGASSPRGLRRRVEEEFLMGLRSEMRDSNHPSARRLRTGMWPRHPWLEPLPLDALEVRLGPAPP